MKEKYGQIEERFNSEIDELLTKIEDRLQTIQREQNEYMLEGHNKKLKIL